VNETRRLRHLEEENGPLKKIVAQQALGLDALKGFHVPQFHSFLSSRKAMFHKQTELKPKNHAIC
jgi:hypothetical protein